MSNKRIVELLLLGCIVVGVLGFEGSASKVHASEPATSQVVGIQNVGVAGRVASNAESSLNLNGATIPDLNAFKMELSQFPNLRRVELCGSNLTNAQMEELQVAFPYVKFVWNIVLGGFWTVRTDQLAFSCNKGPGPDLTDADLLQLRYCRDMMALDLGHNAMSNVSFVRYMPNLRVLIVSSSATLWDISDLKYAKNLVYFESWTTSIQDVRSLQFLVNLKDINLCHTPFLTDISPIMHLPRLERFYISDTGVSQENLALLRASYPGAIINTTTVYADREGWRTHPRYYAMRDSFAAKFAVGGAFLDDFDRLSFFARVFDYNYYVSRYPEAVNAVGNDPVNVLYYYLNEGIYRGHQGNESFNVQSYKSQLGNIYGEDMGAYVRSYLGM